LSGRKVALLSETIPLSILRQFVEIGSVAGSINHNVFFRHWLATAYVKKIAILAIN